MPNPETHVQLHVQKGEPKDPDAWKKCTKDGEKTDFWCMYTGGDWPEDGPGSFQAKTGQGSKTVNLSLVANPIWSNNPNSHGFRITDLTYDPDGELSMVGEAPHVRQLIDNASVDVLPKGTYTIIVAFKDGPGGKPVEDIHCDPGWRNRR